MTIEQAEELEQAMADGKSVFARGFVYERPHAYIRLTEIWKVRGRPVARVAHDPMILELWNCDYLNFSIH